MNRTSRHPILWYPWGKERTRRNAMSLRFSPRLLPGDLQGSNDSHSQRDVGSLPFEARAKSMVICRYSQRSKAKEYLASIDENGQCEGDLRRLRAGRVLRPKGDAAGNQAEQEQWNFLHQERAEGPNKRLKTKS